MGSPPQVFALSEIFNYPIFDDPACAQTDPEIFFPVRAGDPDILTEKNSMYRGFGKNVNPLEVAKSLCNSCNHMEPCRDFAIKNNIRYGVWGGTSERERRTLRKLMYGD